MASVAGGVTLLWQVGCGQLAMGVDVLQRPTTDNWSEG